ncbi:MAG: thioredoxin domain-containing protein, partial [Planctomycetes bacterium]|nr:thioredoxin domain-containing protein [Planctomycetota bacterium]
MDRSVSGDWTRRYVAWVSYLVVTAALFGCGSGSPAEEVSPAPSPASPRPANALIHETSPYLLQHAHNPVRWYPWGQEAFDRARREAKPVFLSVGYSTCYWCHVMEHESFEDEEVAAVLNDRFIAIKVDREERPDIDEQYMLATQLMTGRGGWPNSVWLMPDGRPWMAGTYFPKQQFIEVLRALDRAWQDQRDQVERQADQLAAAIRENAGSAIAQPDGGAPDQALLDAALDQYRALFDRDHGGFGDAPKFPPHGALRVLLDQYRRSGDGTLLPLITRTLDAMRLGGIHDHLGGGFHRYATDRLWLLPHFEKMLYDNAQLMRIYAEAAMATGDPRHREVVEGIFGWLEREMTDPDGLFYSALDSGEVGKEGESYVWRYDEIMRVLGPADGTAFAETYGVEPAGNFHDEATRRQTGENILHLDRALADIAAGRGEDPAVFSRRMAAARERLLERRRALPQPHRDDKILTGWNALAISALAYAGRVLEEPRYLAAAVRAADALALHVDPQGRLLRTSRDGRAKQPAYLDDHAYLLQAMLELHAATGDHRWIAQARGLADTMLADFEDPADGGFFFTADSQEHLLFRSKNLTGGG